MGCWGHTHWEYRLTEEERAWLIVQLQINVSSILTMDQFYSLTRILEGKEVDSVYIFGDNVHFYSKPRSLLPLPCLYLATSLLGPLHNLFTSLWNLHSSLWSSLMPLFFFFLNEQIKWLINLFAESALPLDVIVLLSHYDMWYVIYVG